jgi:NADPH2:quinone reductase
LSLFDAMALGTAGLTVALSLHRMEQNGQNPAMGPIIVTGASGGVGSIAVDILTSRGYSVDAVSGKPAQQAFLKRLGATNIFGRDELPKGTRPLEKGLWGGAIDNVGGQMLATLTRHIKPGGNIASIGLAGGIEFTTTVMPFIIRAVNLLGINSVDILSPLREELWERLASDMRPPHLEDIVEDVIPLEGLAKVFEQMMGGKTHGRILVKTF